MIVFNIIVWSIVSSVWAALAWWKSSEGLAGCAGAAAVVVMYLVGWAS